MQRILADFRAERPEIKPHDRRALEPFDMNEAKEPLHQPPAEIIDAPQADSALA